MNSIWAVVPAAGSGSRMVSDIPKQYREVAGAALLQHTLQALLQSPDIRGVVVALDPSDRRADAVMALSDARVQTTPGGETRAASVLAGLDALTHQATEDDWVLVHDAARPCLELSALSRLIARARELHEGVILAQPVTDTMKSVDDESRVVQTVERSRLWRAQTPQMFPLLQLRQVLHDALQNDQPVTDESMVMEAAGHPVHVVAGPGSNIKVTVEDDLLFAELFLKRQREELP